MKTMFRRKNEDEEKAKAEEAESVKATIATAAVKAEAQSLVGQLRATLARLDKVLQDLPEDDQTGSHGPDPADTPVPARTEDRPGT